MSGDYVHTGVGGSTADAITVRGHDLAGELMGQATFTQLAFLLVAARMPSEGETAVLDAVLVSLAEHGLTPTVLAARLTHTGAPESLQGAVAAGLLGAGTVFLGVVQDTAAFLGAVVQAAGPDASPEALRRAAVEVVDGQLAERRRIPGLGHPVHTVQDPRTPRIYAIAEQHGLRGPHLGALLAVRDAYRKRSGRQLPINGAGAAGAALADLGFAAGIVRGFALLARTAGLVAHLAEEMSEPLGMQLFREVDRRAGG